MTMQLGVCSVEARDANAIEERSFPKHFPNFFQPFKNGYLLGTRSKLLYHNGEDDADVKIVFKKPVISLATNEENIFLVSENRLWRSTPDEPFKFTEIPITAKYQKKSIEQVACGQSHVLVLTNEGEVFARGQGATCGLGLTAEQTEEEFTRIQCVSNVFFIAAGSYHSAVVCHKSDATNGVQRMRPLRVRSAKRHRQQRQIDDSFVRGVVLMSRSDSTVLDCIEAVDNTNPLGDLQDKRRIESEVYVWGTGVGLGLGPSVTEENSPKLLPDVEAVVQLACGAQHTVALTATGQVFVWGEYFPGRTEMSPSGVQLSAHQYVIEIAAGSNITLACAYIQKWPEIYVIDENKCWQRRGKVLLTRQSPSRLYQGLGCSRDDPKGHIMIISGTEADQSASLVNERNAVHELNYNLLHQVRHLHLLRKEFASKWKISTESLETENNVIRYFADLLDSTLKIMDLGHLMSRHLSKETCLLSSVIKERKLPQMLQEFCDIACYFRSLFNDLLAFNCFQSIFEKYKREMIGVIGGILGSRLKRTEESKVPKYLTHEFEKGINMFAEMTQWDALKLQDNRELVAVIQELEKKEDELLCDIPEAVNCAEKVGQYLSSVRTDFFALKRRIRLISKESHIQLAMLDDRWKKTRDMVIVLTDDDFMLHANGKLYVWNYQAVWLENHSEKNLKVDVVLPEFRGTLVASLSTVLDEWVKHISQGICRRFHTVGSLDDVDGVPNRRFQHKFLLFERKDHEYVGTWEKGEMHGNGEYSITKKSGRETVTTTYVGNYYFGKKCGYGKQTKESSTGRSEIIFGAWENGQPHGYAEERHIQSVCNDSSTVGEEVETLRYEGCFCNGKRHGLGRLEERRDGKKFVFLGNWNVDQRCGYGIQLKESAGSQAFFGEFKDDRETELGYTINFGSGDIVSTTWINGSNFKYNLRRDGTGELTYRMGAFNVNLVGKIAREPQQGKWTIKDGVFSVEAATSNVPSLFGAEQDENVSNKWKALVDESKKMLVGDPPVENPWEDYLPSKLKQTETATNILSSLQAYFERFTALYAAGIAEKAPIDEEDWCKIKDFTVLLRDMCPSFPLTFFLKRRTEVFTFFCGVNNRDRLENLVLEELEELMRDTYALLQCLFPVLPTKIHQRATSNPRSSGYDLIQAILPMTFYEGLMTIFAAFTYEAKCQFLKLCDKPISDQEYIEKECCFPSSSQKLVSRILDDIQQRPPRRSLLDKTETSTTSEVHIADIVNKVWSKFSAAETIDGGLAFRLLDDMVEIFESCAKFIKRAQENYGADEMSSFLLYIFWKSRPSNLDLHLVLVRHLTKHYQHYEAYGRWEYVLTTFSIVFESMCHSNPQHEEL